MYKPFDAANAAPENNAQTVADSSSAKSGAAMTAAKAAPTGSIPSSFFTLVLGETFTFTGADILAFFSDPDGDPLSIQSLDYYEYDSGIIFSYDAGTDTYSITVPERLNTQNAYDDIEIVITDGENEIYESLSPRLVSSANAPTVSASTGSLDSNGQFVISEADLLALATDADGDALFVANVRVFADDNFIGEPGAISRNDNGDYVFTLNPQTTLDTVRLSVEISDGISIIGGQSGFNTISLSVPANVNGLPTGSVTSLDTSIDEDGLIRMTVAELLATGSDPEDDAFTAGTLNFGVGLGITVIDPVTGDVIFPVDGGVLGGFPDGMTSGSGVLSVTGADNFDLSDQFIGNAQGDPSLAITGTTVGGFESFILDITDAGSTVTFDLNSDSFDTDVRVFDNQGREISLESNPDRSVSFDANGAGPFTIIVGDGSDQAPANADYTLNITVVNREPSVTNSFDLSSLPTDAVIEIVDLDNGGASFFGFTMQDDMGREGPPSTIFPSFSPPAPEADYTIAEDSGTLRISVEELIPTPFGGEPAIFTSVSGIEDFVMVSIDPETGDILVTPRNNYFGPLDISYEASIPDPFDGMPTTQSGNISVDVTPVNDAPIFTSNDAGQIDVNTSYFINAFDPEFATDPDGGGPIPVGPGGPGGPFPIGPGPIEPVGPGEFGELVQSVTVDPAFGVIQTQRGELGELIGFVFVPAPNLIADDIPLTVTLSDGEATVTEIVVIDVVGNGAIIDAQDDDVAAVEDVVTTINFADLLSNDSDPDGATLTIDQVSNTGVGIFSINIDEAAETITLVTDANFNGVTTFDYRVTDGAGRSAIATATVTVDAVNDAPTFVTGLPRLEAVEDTPFVMTEADLLTRFTDVDGDELSIVSLTQNEFVGTITDNGDGTYTYDFLQDVAGFTTVEVTVTDGTTTFTRSIQLFIENVNDAPVVAGPVDLGSVAEDNSITLTRGQLASNTDDVDNTLLFVEDVTATNGTIVDNGDETWTFTPDADFNGDVDVSYTVRDNEISVAATATLTVTPVNDAPVAGSGDDIGSVDEDTSLTVSIADFINVISDVDGDQLNLSSVTSAMANVTDNGDGTFTITPDANFNGELIIGYRINDGALSDVGTAVVTVNPVNDAPTSAPFAFSFFEDATLTRSVANILLAVTDIDGDTLSVTSVEAGDLLSAEIVDGNLVVTAPQDYNGSTALTLNVTDGTETIAINVPVAVLPVNDAPTAQQIDLGNVLEDGSRTFTTAELIAGAEDVDGDALTVSAVTATNASVTDNGDGTFTVSPDADFNGSVTLSYSVSDATESVAATATLTVVEQNDAPVLAPIALDGTNEDQSFQFTLADLLAGATDIENDSLDVVSISVTSGTLTRTDDNFDYTPDADYNDPVTLSFTVSDGINQVDNVTFFEVRPVNDSPVAGAPVDLGSTDEDTSIFISSAALLANASDIDGDDLSITGSVTADVGAVIADPEGGYRFFPSMDFNGEATFSFTVTDGELNTSATATLTVNPVNDAPIGDTLLPIAINEDTSIQLTDATLLATFSDVDGDILSVVSVTVDQGTLSDNGNGTYTFTPAADFFGDVTLTVTATDGQEDTSATGVISVSNVNDAPAVDGVTDLGTSNEDTARIITTAELIGSASDVDGDALSVSGLSVSTGSVTDLGDGTFRFTPAQDANGAVTFSYQLTDGQLSTTATATLNVLPVNDAPFGENLLPIAILEDENYVLTDAEILQAVSDIDGDALSVVSVSVNEGALTDNGDGSYTITPAADFNGEITITATITDGQATTSVIGGLSVFPVNDAPVVGRVELADLAEDQTLTITVAQLLAGATDVDGDALSVTGLTASTGTISDTGNWTFTYTPDANFNGEVTLSYMVNDGSVAVPATASLTVTPVNDAPVIAPITLTAINEDSDLTVSLSDLSVSDVDGDLIALTAVTSQDAVVTDNGNGTFTITPFADFNGIVDLTFTVSDGTTSTNGAAVLSVLPVNDAPEAGTLPNLTVEEDQSLTLSIAALLSAFSDVDGDTLSIQSVSSQNGTVAFIDGAYVFTPNVGFFGAADLSVTVTDGQASATATGSILVTEVNDAPVVGAVDLGASDEDTSFTFTAAELLGASSDADGDVLTVSAVSATNGQVTDNGDGSYTFTPVDNFNGDVELSFSVSDGQVTVPGTATLVVNSINDNPVVDGPVNLGELAEDGSLLITQSDLLATSSDADGDVLEVEAITASSGTVTDNRDGTFTYTPDADFNGDVSFSYVVDDNQFGVATTATLSVTPVNDAPTVGNVELGNSDEDMSFTFTEAELLASASDVDGDALSVSAISATNGQVTENGDGTYTFTPVANFNGDVELSFSVTDGEATVPATATLTVNPINDNPVVDGPVDLGAIAEDGSLLITQADLLATSSDADGDMLEVEAITASSGTVINNGDGTFTYTPDADFNGDVSFSYVVDDNQFGVAATATLAVNSVNDAPVVPGDVALESGVEDQTLIIAAATLLAGITDADGDALSLVSVTPSTGSIVDNGDGTYSYTPPADFSGDVDFDVTVTDGTATVSRTASATITAVNDAPIAVDDSGFEVVEGETVSINVADLLANDSDVDSSTLTLTSVQDANGGTVTVNGDIVTFTGADAGNASFTYTVADNEGATSTATVSLTVDPATVDGGVELTGGNGRDNLVGTEFNDVLSGGRGRDTLTGLGGDDILDGGNGRDTLFGGDGDDTLIGGRGSDLLEGGEGDDVMTGDRSDGTAGRFDRDIFVLGDTDVSGNDVITDFDVNGFFGGEQSYDRLIFDFDGFRFNLDSTFDMLRFVLYIEFDGDVDTDALRDGDDLIFVFGRDDDGLITNSIRLEDVVGQNGLSNFLLNLVSVDDITTADGFIKGAGDFDFADLRIESDAAVAESESLDDFGGINMTQVRAVMQFHEQLEQQESDDADIEAFPDTYGLDGFGGI